MASLIICLLGWIVIGGMIAFVSISANERPPLFVDAVVWAVGVYFMFLCYTNGG